MKIAWKQFEARQDGLSLYRIYNGLIMDGNYPVVKN